MRNRIARGIPEFEKGRVYRACLKTTNFSQPFELHTDASDRAIGGVLVQNKFPVTFESQKLKDTEQ